MLKRTASACLHLNLNSWLFNVRKISKKADVSERWYKKYLGKKITFKGGIPPDIKDSSLRPELGNVASSSDSSTADKPKQGLAIIMTNDFWDHDSKLPFVWEDGVMLWEMFERLDFKVIWHANYPASEMADNLKGDVKTTSHVGKKIACCISTHGEKSVLLGQDKEFVWIKDMVDTLAKDDPEITYKMRGIPKLFFIDACQGHYLQTLINDPKDTKDFMIKFDVTQDFSRIAENADVLLGFATYQLNLSTGIPDLGSHYINELTKYLPKHTTEDIHVVLAGVCKQVQSILLYKSNKAQLPMILSTLTEKVTFSN